MTASNGSADHPGDRIELRGLRVLAFCGVLAEEQARRQPFAIDVDVYTDLAGAGATDDLSNTVDYGSLCATLDQLEIDERFDLLERFATRIAELVLREPPVSAVTVAVHKLRPPVPQQLDSSGVRIHRAKSRS